MTTCGAILYRKLAAEGTGRVVPCERLASGRYGLGWGLYAGMRRGPARPSLRMRAATMARFATLNATPIRNGGT